MFLYSIQSHRMYRNLLDKEKKTDERKMKRKEMA